MIKKLIHRTVVLLYLVGIASLYSFGAYYIAEIEKNAVFSNPAKLLLDMVLNAEFSQENFEMEKKVIIQEAKEGLNPYNTLNCLIAKKAYGYHDNQELYGGYYGKGT